MASSFKNKLHDLSDEEFSEILVNRELFSGKKLKLLDQEARNRYFSNKEFNGEDDVYVHPDTKKSVESNRKSLIWTVSVAVVAIVSIFFYINQDGFKAVPNELALVDAEVSGDFKNVTSNTAPENIEAHNDVAQVSDSIDKKIPTSDITQTPVNRLQTTHPSTSDNKPVESKIATQASSPLPNQPIANNPTKNETEKITPEMKAEEMKISIPATSKTGVVKKPVECKVNDLSTENLRQLVKFQNDWADRQKTFQGVTDYYVDGNVTIKFILNQQYTDSIGQYQKRFVPNLTGKYWKDLDKELGEQFPRTPLQIIFVRFDSEL